METSATEPPATLQMMDEVLLGLERLSDRHSEFVACLRLIRDASGAAALVEVGNRSLRSSGMTSERPSPTAPAKTHPTPPVGSSPPSLPEQPVLPPPATTPTGVADSPPAGPDDRRYDYFSDLEKRIARLHALQDPDRGGAG